MHPLERHDRLHPVLAITNLEEVRTFYRTAGWAEATPPAWAEVGAVTLVRWGCPLTFIPADSTPASTSGVVIVTELEDLDAAVRTLRSEGAIVTRCQSSFGDYAELRGPAGVRHVFHRVGSVTD